MPKSTLLAFFLGGLAAALAAAAGPAPRLHLRFDEGQGAIAQDSSGNGHHARLVNPQWEKFGLRGQALRLNGADALVELPDHPDLDLSQGFTLSIWVKPEDFKHGMSLFNHGNYAVGWQTYFYRSFIAFSSLVMKTPPDAPAGNGVYYCRFASGTRPAYPYCHLVITAELQADNLMTFSYYINGKKQSSFQRVAPLPKPKRNLTIGNYASNEGQWYHGLVDEVKLFTSALTPEQIMTEYTTTSAPVPEPAAAKAAAAAADMPAAPLPPLRKTRVALFAPPALYGAPLRPLEWFERELSAWGLAVTRLTAAELEKTTVLNRDRFDTLILPVGTMPFEAEYSIHHFLAAGGCLFTPTNLPATNLLDEHGNPQLDADGMLLAKSHNRGWYAPFLIRRLPFSWARRKAISPLAVHPDAARLVGNRLPPVFGPDPQLNFAMIDRWNLQNAVSGREGDTDVQGGLNYPLAADVMLPLYQERNGEPGDFHVYRYFNRLFFNATLVEFGAIGARLLQSEQGPDVLRALFHLAENPLPGEADHDFYRQILALNEDCAEAGRLWAQVTATARDAAFLAQLKQQDFEQFNAITAAAWTRLDQLLRDKRGFDDTIAAQKPHADGKAKLAELKAECAAVIAQFKQDLALARQALGAARPPAPVKINHPLETLRVEAFLVLPTNLALFRDRLFDCLREIGVNTFSGQMHSWYARDPQTRAAMGDIWRDLNFIYAAQGALIPNSGDFRPSDGTVVDGPDFVPKPEIVENHLRNLLPDWQGHPLFRIGVAPETMLGTKYWGKQATRDFQSHLQKHYQNIAALNAHWGTTFADFTAIDLPTRQPTTPADHARWEHWRQLREYRLEHDYLQTVYDIVKKQAPDLRVFTLPSTGCLNSPLYGVNYYNITRHQDINAADGTAVDPGLEWVYLDLTRTRHLTGEWGGLYQAKPLTYVNGKLWEELTGGSVGFNLWLWQFGNGDVDYFDFVGLPTRFGHVAKMTVQDAAKISHVILDGERATPEIGILYSQATRCHDQAWGWRGEKTTSPHIQSVANSYSHFLKHFRSARVVPEEMLAEGTLPPIKVLFLPNTTFLARDIQEKILLFAKNGGQVVIEGRAGKFDNFGQDLDLLFRSAEIVPGFAPERTLSVLGQTCSLAADDTVFAPIAPGRVLATFGQNTPAVVSTPYGQGRIVTVGCSLLLKQYPLTTSVIHAILHDLHISPRFQVSTDDVLLREWRHGDDTYLLLASRQPDWTARPTVISVRGNCRIEDYLFSQDVNAKYENGYTSFTTLVANGGRVFRLPGAAPAGPELADALAAPETQTTAPAASGPAEMMPMPFQGRLQDDQPGQYADCTFRLSTISAGLDADDGETYLFVSDQHKTSKKRLLVNQDRYFRMTNRIFKVRSSNHFYKIPFHADLHIEEIAALPPEPAAAASRSGDMVTAANSLLALNFDTARGAQLKSIVLQDDLSEQIMPAASTASALALTGSVPGPFVDMPFSPAVENLAAGECKIVFTQQQAAPKSLTQTVRLLPGMAGFGLTATCTNQEKHGQATFDLRWHPELAVGGSADSADLFVIPGVDGIKRFSYGASLSGRGVPPGAEWAAVIDRHEKLAYVTTFNRQQVKNIYAWEASNFYTLEVFAPSSAVPAGQGITLDLGFFFLRGLQDLDAVSANRGLHVDVPDTIDQGVVKDIAIALASAASAPQTVTLAGQLLRGEVVVANLPEVAARNLAFDTPVDLRLPIDLSHLPDGDYTLAITEKNAVSPLAATKKITFAGKRLAELLAFYEKAQLLLKTDQTRSQNDAFKLRARLEELRTQIANRDLAQAEKLKNQIADDLRP